MITITNDFSTKLRNDLLSKVKLNLGTSYFLNNKKKVNFLIDDMLEAICSNLPKNDLFNRGYDICLHDIKALLLQAKEDV